MSKIYFTSDLHFGHNKPFLYEPRGFSSIEEHDAAVIERWNSVVTQEDEVYILGDLMLNDNANGLECISKLNGIKHYIIGNHDTPAKIELYKSVNIDCLGYASFLKYKKLHFYISHYPTMVGNGKEELCQCTINLYGHTHQQTNFYEEFPFMYHVGLDSHNCYPVLIDDIIADIKKEFYKDKD